MIEYLPYVVSILVATISGFVSCLVAIKNAKNNLETVKVSNQHDLEKLIEQHKIDIDSLERAHAMDLEKINLEHKHQMESSQKSFENQFGSGMLNALLPELLKTPEFREQLTNSMKHKKN